MLYRTKAIVQVDKYRSDGNNFRIFQFSPSPLTITFLLSNSNIAVKNIFAVQRPRRRRPSGIRVHVGTPVQALYEFLIYKIGYLCLLRILFLFFLSVNFKSQTYLFAVGCVRRYGNPVTRKTVWPRNRVELRNKLRILL